MTRGDRVREELGPLVGEGGPPGWDVQIVAFLHELEVWNERVNLVSRASIDSALEAHVVPSLATLRVVERGRALRVLDVGSGGGFPGIPLRILRPHIRLDLVEATRKKCRFLEHCVELLELSGTRVHWCRVEAPSPELLERAPFDLAFSRAVGHTERIVAATRRLLGPSGETWLFASPGEPDALTWTNVSGRPVTALRKAL